MTEYEFLKLAGFGLSSGLSVGLFYRFGMFVVRVLFSQTRSVVNSGLDR